MVTLAFDYIVHHQFIVYGHNREEAEEKFNDYLDRVEDIRELESYDELLEVNPEEVNGIEIF